MKQRGDRLAQFLRHRNVAKRHEPPLVAPHPYSQVGIALDGLGAAYRPAGHSQAREIVFRPRPCTAIQEALKLSFDVLLLPAGLFRRFANTSAVIVEDSAAAQLEDRVPPRRARRLVGMDHQDAALFPELLLFVLASCEPRCAAGKGTKKCERSAYDVFPQQQTDQNRPPPLIGETSGLPA